MPVYRPSHLDLFPDNVPYSPRTTNRHCETCHSTYPNVVSPQLMPVTYMVPMVYSPQNPVYVAPPSPTPIIEENKPYEKVEEVVYEKPKLMRIRNFEETNWIPIGEDIKVMQDAWIKRDNYFQKSLELPDGYLLSLNLIKMSEQQTNFNQRSQMRTKLLLQSVIQPTTAPMSETDSYEQTLLLPMGADLNSVTYKVISRSTTIQTEPNYYGKLKNASTTDNLNGDGVALRDPTKNTVLVIGKFKLIPETPKPARVWSKQYMHSVSGRIDLLPEGKLTPTTNTYSELPDYVAEQNSTPDRDTTYTMLPNECQICMRLDDKVNKSSIRVVVDETEEKIRVTFNRHFHKTEAGQLPGDAKDEGIDFDLNVNQVFKLSPDKFDIHAIRHVVEDDKLVIHAPFRKSRN